MGDVAVLAVSSADGNAARQAGREAFLSRCAHGFAMLVAVAVMQFRSSAIERGFIFSFLSLGTLIGVFEFGLSPALVRSLSHFRALGDAEAQVRTWRTASRWSTLLYGISAAFLCVVGVAIFAISDARNHIEHSSPWLVPWLVFATLCGVMQWGLLRLAYLEGTGAAELSYRCQRDVEITSGVAFVVALGLGSGLWSCITYGGVRVIVLLAWVAKERARFPNGAAGIGRASWVQRIWAFQWRVGLNALTSFVMARALVPIILLKLGPASAGSFGVAWAAMGMLVTIAAGLPQSQTAYYTTLRVTGNIALLSVRFRRMLAVTSGGACVFAIGGVVLVALLESRSPFMADRLPDTTTFAFLLAASVVQVATSCFYPFLRADGSDPLLGVNLGVGISTLALCGVLASENVHVISAAYLACTCVAIPLCLWSYHTKLNQWRASSTRVAPSP